MSTSSIPLSYFALLDLAEGPQLDRAALEQAYQRLQSRWHPDQFAGADAATRSRAVRQTSLINDAYRTLREPVSRAAHLLALQGLDPLSLNQHELAPDFLLSQMQWREELEAHRAAADEGALALLRHEVDAEFEQAWQDFVRQFANRAQAEAKREFHKLQFLAKLQDEINEAEDALLDS